MDRHDRRHLPGYQQLLARGFQHNSVPEPDHIDAIGVPAREPVGTVFGLMEPECTEDVIGEEEPEMFFPSNKPSSFQRHQDLPTLQRTQPAKDQQRHSPVQVQRTTPKTNVYDPPVLQRKPNGNTNRGEIVEADGAPSYRRPTPLEENANPIIPDFHDSNMSKVDPRRADLVSKLWKEQQQQYNGSVDSGLGSSSITFPSRDETSFESSVDNISERLRDVTIPEDKEFSIESNRISITPPSEKESPENVLERQTSIVEDDINANNLNNATAKFQRNMKYFDQDDDLDTNLHHLLYADRDQDFLTCLDDLMSYHMLDVVNRRKQTLLHVATIMNKPEMCRAIMVHGSSVDSRDSRGNTPLHIACQKGSIECVEVLTKHLNYNEVKDLGYQVPFRCIPQSMELRNYDGQTCLHLAVAGGHHDIVYYLVHDMMADVNAAEGKRGLTPLMDSVERRDARMLMYLVQQCGANIHLRTYDRKNALELAQGRGYTDIANLLLSIGAETQVEEEEECDWIEEDFDDFTVAGRSIVDE